MKRHPAYRWTLTKCYQELYDKSEQSPEFRRAIVAQLHGWERYSGGPPVGAVTNETVMKWRTAMIEAGYAPLTIKSYWTTIRAVFRRIGPVFNGNPLGLGIIDAVPYCKPVKFRRKLPKRISLDQLNRVYLAARHTTKPRRIFTAPDYWRALLAILYTTGLRIGDALRIRCEHIDLEERTLFIHVGKTGVEAELPLHVVACDHIHRIGHTDREFLFGSPDKGWFYHQWRELIGLADVEYFTPHDIRRVACSEVDAAWRGMGKVLLLHSPLNVTEASYLNSLPELRQALDKMEIPIAFKHGINVSDKQLQQVRRQHIAMNTAVFAPPGSPSPAEFQWHSDGFMFAGRFCALRCGPRVMLQTLVEAEKPVGWQTLLQALGQQVTADSECKLINKRLWHLRCRLRHFFGLPDSWDPIPAATSATWDKHHGTTYRVVLPADLAVKGGAA